MVYVTNTGNLDITLQSKKEINRIKEIDVATGIAIILVVTGHALDKFSGNYLVIKSIIYDFHMPFFMCISGFLYFKSVKGLGKEISYTAFLKQKLTRFGVPYFLLSLIYLFAKIVIADDSSDIYFEQNLYAILFYPTSGETIFLWYIYILMFYYACFTSLMLIPWVKSNLMILIFIGILFQIFNPEIEIFEMNLFFNYFIYFSLGIVLSNQYAKVKNYLKSFGLMALISFVIIIGLKLFYFDGLPKTLASFLSIPSILYLSTILSPSKLLTIIGKNTFSIYLWHSAIIFASNMILTKFYSVHKDQFPLYLFILVSIGILIPIMIKKIGSKFNLKLINVIFP